MFHKRLLKEFRDLNRKIGGIVAAQWLMLAANIIMIYALASFFQKLSAADAGHREAGIYTCIVLGAVILRFAMTKLHTVLLAEISSVVKIRMRRKIFEKLVRLGTQYREQMKSSQVNQFTTEGVEQLEIYFGQYVPQFFYSMLSPLILFAVTSFISLKIGIVLLICVPLIPISIMMVQKFAKKMLAKYWGTYTEMGDSFLECLQGLTTLKIYDADKYYADKMDEEAENFRKVTMKVLIMQLNSISVMDLVAYGGAGAGILLTVAEMNAGNITFAQGFFLVMIAAEYFLPMRLLGSFFHIAMNGNAAADKIFALLDTPEEEALCGKSGNTAVDLEKNVDKITLRSVHFSYDKEKEILKDVSMDLTTGLTALAGVSGCGKSTITSLLMKKNRVNAGVINIGDVSLDEVESEKWYQQITRIGHDAYLFAGSIRSNLLMAKEDAAEQEMLQVLERVNMLSVIKEKGGLDCPVLERGSNFSGGQKQRIALARALLRDNPVYIFDEAASNVDVESEDDIMKVIRELAKTRIVLLISHRLANVVNADRIYVMEDGSIAAQGTHEELMKRPGIYRELYTEQTRLENYRKEALSCES